MVRSKCFIEKCEFGGMEWIMNGKGVDKKCVRVKRRGKIQRMDLIG